MSKAAQLAKQLESLDIKTGMDLILESHEEAIFFEVIKEAMCIMHDDGSVNIIENLGSGKIVSEVISPANILKVLHHYRPFKDLFAGKFQ